MTKATAVRGHQGAHPSLFDQFEEYGRRNAQRALAEAERALLEIADYVYAHTSLKPMSKTLFLISRSLCVAKLAGGAATSAELCREYARIRASLDGAAPDDDFDFSAVVGESEQAVPHVLRALDRVCRLTQRTDSLGLVFNTLLRGKFEGGEGLGTFLTPEEVVFPMVDVLLKVLAGEPMDRFEASPELLYGDICGGTGRFVYAIARRLEARGISRERIQRAARLFDQSVMAVDLGKLNFLFDGMKPTFERVGDSLTAPQVSSLRSRFLLLATNPPFGSGKYRWSEALATALGPNLLGAVGMKRRGDSADPSVLFFFRNLDLLAPGGALAIVMPDGVVQSEAFRAALAVYERDRSTRLHVAAMVSLPPVTFALGGTVAKTSFLVVQREEQASSRPLYVAVAHHVGFTKRGGKRANDANGNDIERVPAEFESGAPSLGRFVPCWRSHQSLVPARLMHGAEGGPASVEAVALSEIVIVVRSFVKDQGGAGSGRFHVSVLDVDPTGLIDIVSASTNRPISRGLACRPGDILLSCMNPRIWRVAVVPAVSGSWSCSPEFVVLRPKKCEDTWRIALALHHPSVTQSVQAMARGTSSSRQRVPKDRILSVQVPEVQITDRLAEYVAWRDEFYRNRLREARAYDQIHSQRGFVW